MNRIVEISDPEIAREVLGSEVFRVDNPLRATRKIFGLSVLDTEGHTHWRKKRNWNMTFSRTAVADRFAHIIKAAVPKGIAMAEARGNLLLAAECIPNFVILDILGRTGIDPIKHYAQIQPIAKFLETAMVDKKLEAAVEYVRTLVGSGNPTPFARIAPEDRQTETMLLLLAGVETTVVAMEEIILHWFSHEASLYAEVEVEGARAAIMNTLKRDAPLGLATRFCVKEGGSPSCPVSRGDIVHVNLFKAARSDSRDLQHDHLVFGAGKHRCPGSHLALLELETLLEALLHRSPANYRLEDKQDNKPRPSTFRHPASTRLCLKHP
jgi:cytochrome P450